MRTDELAEELRKIALQLRELRLDNGSGWVQEIDAPLRLAEKAIRSVIVDLEFDAPRYSRG